MMSPMSAGTVRSLDERDRERECVSVCERKPRVEMEVESCCWR